MPFTHEVETAFQKGQLGIEVAYGTGVAATIALGSVTLTPQIRKTTNKFTPNGVLLPTVLGTGRQYTEISFEGQATYEEVGYFLKDVVSDAQIDPLTLQMVYTVEAGGLQIPGSIVSAVTLRGNRDEVALSGTMLGKAPTVQAPTAALAIPTQTPIDPAGVVITVDGSVLSKAFEWELAINDMWGGATFIGSATFASILQKAIDASFRVKVESDASGLALLSEESVVACSIVCTTGAKVLTIEFDAKVGEPGPFSDEEGIYAIEHNLTVMNKATSAISVTIA